jgi:tRNA 2-thiouridine synthesizing protein C
MTRKSLAIVNAKAPFSSVNGKDALDVALIFGAYEQALSLFFQGDGVWQLMPDQSAQAIDAKDYLKTFAALEFYDIEHIYVCQHSLSQRGLDKVFSIDNVIVLDPEDFCAQLHLHQHIFRF